MPRPVSQPALGKAPRRPHPAAPAPASSSAAPSTPSTGGGGSAAAPAPSTVAQLTMFSVRIQPALRRRVKRYAAETEESVQAITEAALREYLDRREVIPPSPA